MNAPHPAPVALLSIAALVLAAAAPVSAGRLRRLVPAAALAALGASLVAAALAAWRGAAGGGLADIWPPGATLLACRYDALAAVMATLVSLVGWVVARFSARALAGDPRQGRFLRWLAGTLAATLGVILAGNLALLFASWVLTSLCLHQLLTHRSDRPLALAAARRKFVVSRLGDAMLLAALVLVFRWCGSLGYEEVFAAAERARESGVIDPLAAWAAVLVVAGAMTKSAQMPFHAWLPDSVEAPTPVSALMHAGIINAGGFLVLRLSPLVATSQAALDVLALVGGATALVAAVAMSTQPSIKRALAYSTVAQMGFMMLECGLGAFAAALAHLVAHSVYKAYAFLASGEAVASRTTLTPTPITLGPLSLAASTLGAAAYAAACGWMLGVGPGQTPGALALVAVLAIAVAALVVRSLRSGERAVAARGVATAALVCLAAQAAHAVAEGLLADSVWRQSADVRVVEVVLAVLVAGGFIAVAALEGRIAAGRPFPVWLERAYVHARAGFYADIYTRRVTRRLWLGGRGAVC